MSWRIEKTTEEFTLPDDEALCLGPDGWIKEAAQIHIQGALSLAEALGTVWDNQKGLLGFGELVFYQVDGFRGFLVFHPSDDEPE